METSLASAQSEGRSAAPSSTWRLHLSALLFDLDGTLVDSTAVVERTWREWARGVGLDAATFLHTVHGRPGDQVMAEVLPGRPADWYRAENKRLLESELHMLDGVVALPGAGELLAELHPSRWAIATSCPRDLALARLGAAGLPVPQGLITINDVTAGKPDPECFRRGAATLGVSPLSTLVVEDAPAGVAAGLSAGALVLGVGSGHADAARPTLGADGLSSVRVRGGGAALTDGAGPWLALSGDPTAHT